MEIFCSIFQGHEVHHSPELLNPTEEQNHLSFRELQTKTSPRTLNKPWSEFKRKRIQERRVVRLLGETPPVSSRPARGGGQKGGDVSRWTAGLCHALTVAFDPAAMKTEVPSLNADAHFERLWTSRFELQLCDWTIDYLKLNKQLSNAPISDRWVLVCCMRSGLFLKHKSLDVCFFFLKQTIERNKGFYFCTQVWETNQQAAVWQETLPNPAASHHR